MACLTDIYLKNKRCSIPVVEFAYYFVFDDGDACIKMPKEGTVYVIVQDKISRSGQNIALSYESCLRRFKLKDSLRIQSALSHFEQGYMLLRKTAKDSTA